MRLLCAGLILSALMSSCSITYCKTVETDTYSRTQVGLLGNLCPSARQPGGLIPLWTSTTVQAYEEDEHEHEDEDEHEHEHEHEDEDEQEDEK